MSRQTRAPQTPQTTPARRCGPPQHQGGAIERAGLRQQGLRDAVAAEHHGLATQFFGQLEHGQGAVALHRRQPLQGRRFHVGGMPAHIELAGQACRAAHRVLGALARPNTDQQCTRGVPGVGATGAALAGNLVLAGAVAAHIVTHMFGGAAQRDFTQRKQISLAKKVLCRALGLLRHIDLAGLKARQQFIGRHIHQNQLIGVVQHGVGHGLVDADAGDGTDRAVQAFQVLHIERCPDVDAGVQQLLHILPALGVARTGCVAVGQFVQQQHLGFGLQGCVNIKLQQHLAPVGHFLQRQAGQARQQFFGLAPAMGFYQTNEHRLPGCLGALRGAEHGKGFSHPGAGTKVDAQLAACHGLRVLAQLRQQCVGVGAVVGGGHGVVWELLCFQCDVIF